MPRGDAQPRNHPRPGSCITVEPIRDPIAILAIKRQLWEHNRRDYCLFTLGINTAYRGSELLSLTVGQVQHLMLGDLLQIWQSKTKKYRATTMNRSAIEAIHAWLPHHPRGDQADAPFFLSQRSRGALNISVFSRSVKRWCAMVGLNGNFGSHTLRKTWGYQQRVRYNAPLPVLMKAYGHKTESQTLTYLHIQEGELQNLFMNMEL